MTFKLVPNPTFKAAVNLTVPGQEAAAQIELEFRYKSPETLKAWFESAREESKSTSKAITEIVIGWNGVLDEKDQPLEFNPELLATLLHNYAPAGGEILNAYVAALTESRVKN